MISIPGYILTEDIVRESNNFTIYRGVHKSDNSKVLIKVLKDNSNLKEQVERFRFEYELINSLDGEGTVKAFALEKYENRLALIMQDFGKSTLHELIKYKIKLSIDEFLKVAVAITEALEKIHNKHIIHKNLNPENILWDDTNQEAKIIDFGVASVLSRETPEIIDSDFFQTGMLNYISPEQTGRMNRGIDYRTDYYSLGIIFYEMVTGELAFKSDDIGELVHFHIAKIPTSPSVLDASIPQPIADIIMKLLAKTSEDRYQSLYGLKEDLKICIEQINKTGEISAFKVGEKDLHAHFHISEKFYGREEELDHLLNAFNQASEGRARLILVSGYAGIGKSTLVHELYKPLVEKRGYFIAGKFDQFKRNIPYMSLTQAFEGFIQQISTFGEQKVGYWSERIQQALGSNGKIIVDVIPGLTSLIGEQPAVPILGPTETQNRFNLVFQNFIRALATEEHPLAIFLDDLQWADLPSLKLLETLLLYPDSKYFLIIGAFRNNEVDQDHILTSTLEILRKSDFYFNIIKLKPLGLKHISELLMDTLHQDEASVKSLAEICFDKTQGNPFFLNQFLQTLYAEGLFEFNFHTDHWYWDINKIKEKDITSNVVQLMVERLQELPQDTQKIIQYASCLGNKFNLATLALISEKTVKETSNKLWTALDKGLIVPMATTYKYVSDAGNIDVNYQFAHDRVQQAAYSMLEEGYRNWLRLKIGRLLLENTPKNKLDEKVIEIVNQANFGIDLMTDPRERAFFARMNLNAGKKAKASVAYKVALNYLEAGILLLENESWKRQYELTLALYTETVEAAYLATQFDEMELTSKMVIDNATNLLDKIKVYEIQILYLTNHHEYDKAIEIMQSVLREVGINLPDKPSTYHIILYLIRTKIALLGKKINELENLPEMTDPQRIAAVRIIRSTAGAVYLANPNLFVLSGFQAILFLIKYGNTPQAGRSYVVYGHILCGALNQLETGYQFGQLSMKLCDKYGAENIMAQVWMVHGVFIKHWHDSLQESMQLTFNAFQKGLETGDIEYAGYSISAYHFMCISHGNELTEMDREINKYKSILISIEQRTAYNWIAAVHQAVLNLLGTSQETTSLKGQAFDESVVFPDLIVKKDNIGGLVVCIMKMLLCYLFEDYKQAYEWGKKGNIFTGAIGVFLLPPYYFMYSLACLACYDISPKNERSVYLKQVKQNQAKMRLWAKHAPMNYSHRYYLVEAEYARILNNSKKAESYYDLAISLAKQYKYIQDEALANEITARYYLIQGSERIAKAYVNDAYNLYAQWGALAKTKQFEKKYSHLLATRSIIDIKSFKPLSMATRGLKESLDLTTIMKTSQTISREIELETLLKKMMHIVIENAGAQKGYLLLEKEGRWYIEAKSTVESEDVSVLKSIPFESELPITIIEHIIRTNSSLVLDDATRDDQFSFDPYIKRNQPKSIFCLPLLNQGVLSGILYMENNLTMKAFTPSRMNLLNGISTQIVVAIYNARQYNYIKMLTAANQRFIPNEYLTYLKKKSISEIKLGDQVQKDLTVMFCDIRNFTTISEMMTPQETMNFLNQYLSEIEPVVLDNHGFIDKYIGDGFVAIYDSPEDALNAAIGILHALDNFNNVRLLNDSTTISIGIGLSSGLVTIGVVGVEHRLQGAVISDEIRIAETVQDLTKNYHIPLIISKETYLRLNNPAAYAIRKLDTVKISEQTVATDIYEVFDNEQEAQIGLKNSTFRQFEQAIELYRQQNYVDAAVLFQEIVTKNRLDLPAAYYLERCQVMLQ